MFKKALFLLLFTSNTFASSWQDVLTVVNPLNSNEWVKLTLTYSTDVYPGVTMISGTITSGGCEEDGVKIRLKADTWNYVLSADFPSIGGGWSNPQTDSTYHSIPMSYLYFWDKIQFSMPPGKTSYFRYEKWNSTTVSTDQPKFIITINGDVVDKNVAVQTGDKNDQIFCGIANPTAVVSIAMNGGNDLFAAYPASQSEFHVQLGAGDDVAQAGAGQDDYVFPGTGTNDPITNFEQVIAGNEESWWTW